MITAPTSGGHLPSVRRQRGLSLLEVVLAIAAGAVVVVSASLFYNLAAAANRTDQAAQQIQFTVGTVRNLYSGVSSYAGMDAASLQNAKVYPPQMFSGSNVVNPWGGGVNGVVDSSDTTNLAWDLTYLKVPQDACAKLIAISNTAYGGGILDVRVNAYNASNSVATTSALGVTPPSYAAAPWTISPATAASKCNNTAGNTITFVLN